MGGRIWVDSEQGIGSTFHFTVKLKKSKIMPDKTAALEEAGVEDVQHALNLIQSKKILLVEDNEINQELVMDLLNSNGMTVESAYDGQEALDILEKQSFDAVLMDCQMPVMDGYDATRKIRELEKFRELPVFALTANVMKGDREKALNAGMNDHISKPINPDVLFMTMARWIT